MDKLNNPVELPNSIHSDEKFTIIVSAYRSSNTPLENMLATEDMANYLEYFLGVSFDRALGVYEGQPEQSFVVHSSNSREVRILTSHALQQYKQECILVRRNDFHKVMLYFPNKVVTVGRNFTLSASVPDNAEGYTILKGKDYYTVTY